MAGLSMLMGKGRPSGGEPTNINIATSSNPLANKLGGMFGKKQNTMVRANSEEDEVNTGATIASS